MTKRTTSFTTIVATSIFLFQTGCSKPQEQALGQVREIVIAQWGQERYLIYLPLYVAMERGLLERRGIHARLTFTGNDDQTFAAVVGGSAQFGVGDPVFTAISQERGFPAKVVATIVGGVAIWGVTNSQSVPSIDSPRALAGLRIGTFPSPSTNYTLMKELIASNQPLLANTSIVQAPIDAQLALLEGNKADIAMVLEPAASIAESRGYRVVYSSPRFHGPYAFTGLTTTGRLIEEDRKLVAAVVSALEDAVTLCHKDRKVAYSVATHLFPTLGPSVVEHAVSRMIDERTFPEHVAVDDHSWQEAIKTRLSVGDLKAPQLTSVSVDNSFATQAQVQSPKR